MQFAERYILVVATSLFVVVCIAVDEEPQSQSQKAFNFYPVYPGPGRPFGGDRSDQWLYPPRKYYVNWVYSEWLNDWNNQRSSKSDD